MYNLVELEAYPTCCYGDREWILVVGGYANMDK